jgi:hypothetical protein
MESVFPREEKDLPWEEKKGVRIGDHIDSAMNKDGKDEPRWKSRR